LGLPFIKDNQNGKLLFTIFYTILNPEANLDSYGMAQGVQWTGSSSNRDRLIRAMECDPSTVESLNQKQCDNSMII
jgi:hypothetical protein